MEALHQLDQRHSQEDAQRWAQLDATLPAISFPNPSATFQTYVELLALLHPSIPPPFPPACSGKLPDLAFLDPAAGVLEELQSLDYEDFQTRTDVQKLRQILSEMEEQGNAVGFLRARIPRFSEEFPAENLRTTAQQRLDSAELLERKSQEYEQRSSNLLSLSASLASPSKTPDVSDLLAASDEVKALSKRLKELKARLGAFDALPPDLGLARLKVKEKRNELASLVAKRDQALQDIGAAIR